MTPLPIARVVSPLLAALAVAYGAWFFFYVANNTLLYGYTWLDEVTYLIKSWWYVHGAVPPYSDQDATWYMPLFFYQLGWTQALFGQGHEVGRATSIVLALASAVFLAEVAWRLTGNVLAAGLAAGLYLATPPATHYFATATPYASFSLWLLLAVRMLVVARHHGRDWHAALFGIVLAVLFFYRQNAVLMIVLLAPLYVAAQTSDRLRLATIMAVATAMTAALMFALFPDKLFFYALRLPVITPLFAALGWLPDDLALIQQATVSPYSLGFSFASLSGETVINYWLLPYAGFVAASSAGLVVLWRRQRRWLFLPLAFLFLSITHYAGAAGYCGSCILPYTAYFIAIGALAAAVLFAAVLTSMPAMVGGLVAIALAANVLWLNLNATRWAVGADAYALKQIDRFPLSAWRLNGEPVELPIIDELAAFISTQTPEDKAVLVIHARPAVAYAVAKAGRMIPVQSLNPTASYRAIAPEVPTERRADVAAALERESLWTDVTLERWIGADYDVVALEGGAAYVPDHLKAALERDFDVTAETMFTGQPVKIYVRRAAPL